MTNFTLELAIIAGLGKVFGDSSSAEAERRSLDLLYTGIGGFAVQPDAWIPSLPQQKGSAWADSALADGRELVASAAGNVVETMTLTAQAATLEQRYTLERILHEIARLARDFWTGEFQSEPVYLLWRAAVAPGPQYALIHTLDVAQSGSGDSIEQTQEITITIEREPYWRALPPGANPKLWTFESRGLRLGPDFNLNNLSLVADTSHLVYDPSVDNLREWNSTYTAFVSHNYIDIPASLIPGDAPALVEIAIKPQVGEISTLYLARATGPEGFIGRGWTAANSGITTTSVLRFNTFNAGDSYVGINQGADIVNSPDGPRNAAGTRQRLEIDFSGSAAMNVRTSWGSGILTSTSLFDLNLNAGKYACFLRARQSGGSANTIKMKLVFASRNSDATLSLSEVTAQIDATFMDLYYMGTVDLPWWANQSADPRGYGKASGESADCKIQLYASRSSGAGELYVTDLILMPIHESMIALVNDDEYPVDGNHYLIYDTTGYMIRGKPGAFCGVWKASTFNFMGSFPQVLGQDLTLLPGVNNRLYFLGYDAIDGNANLLTLTYEVRLNIVPRWSGVRDA